MKKLLFLFLLALSAQEISVTACLASCAPKLCGPTGDYYQSVYVKTGITIGNGTDVITTGVKGFIEIPFSGTITRWTLLSVDAATPTSGAIVIDVWKDTYANFPPTVTDTMIATGTKPTITATGNKGQDTTVDWATLTVSAGDILGFNVDSVTSLKKVVLVLTIQHT